MSANGTIALDWANGSNTFCVGKIDQLLDLEEKCGAGVFEIAERLESVALASAEGRLGGKARINDVRETIRLGLIGGGMSAIDAMRLVRKHVDNRPALESVLLAYSILAAVLRGVPGDEPGKAQADRAAEQGSGSTKTDASSDPPSTGSARRSTSRRGKSTR